MNKKLFLWIVGGFAAASIMAVVGVGLVFFMAFGGANIFLPNPPEPEITYGEFPISITYEVNGELRKLEDVVICEFDGFENLGSGGKRRRWKAHLKSGNARLTLLKIDETTELYCSYGMPEYYMGDLRYMSKEEYEQMREDNFDSYFITFGEWVDGKLKSKGISVDEAWENYHLKILNREYAPPIENTFK